MRDAEEQLRVFRPFGARIVSATCGCVLILLVGFLWLTLPPRVRAEFGTFQRLTLLAFFCAVIVLLYGIFRTKVTTSEQGISVINGYRRHELDWAQTVAISLNHDRPWALADLTDGSTVALMALQTADGARATRSARELSRTIAARAAPDAASDS